MSVILGAETPEQLADDVVASDLKELAALDVVSVLKPRYPRWRRPS